MADAIMTKGCLAAIFQNPEEALTAYPTLILQCLQVKALQASGETGAARYRIVVSDSVNYAYGMLATQSNHVVQDGKMVRNSMISVTSYQANMVKGKNVLVVLEIEVLEQYQNLDKIGDPALLEASPAAKEQYQQQQQQQPTTIPGHNFYGAKQDTAAAAQQTKPRSGPVPGAVPRAQQQQQQQEHHGGNRVYPISAVTPYANKWTIKARVTSKSDVRTWHKASGEGRIFSVNLLDESGEIKLTGFNEQVDQFYDLFQEGSVFYISTPCKVAIAKKQWNNLPHDYELTLERDTSVEKAEDQTSVPQMRFNFCSIQDIGTVEKDSTIDVIGVLKEIGDLSEIKSKTTGKPYEKRDVTIVDNSGYSIRVTVWGKLAQSYDVGVESVVAFKGTKVSDFGGRSLSLLASGTMAVDPDITEAHQLKGWYDAAGRRESFATHGSGATSGALGAASGRPDVVKVISQVKDEGLGTERDDYFALKATILHIKQDSFAYPACRTDGCNKKVIETTDGGWRCERCSITHERPNYRYIFSANVGDHTGQIWLSCFDEPGKEVMGIGANELTEIAAADDDQKSVIINSATCKSLTFRVRAKMDQFGDNPRIRYQAMTAGPIDFAAEGRRLAELIKHYDINS